MTLSIWFQKVSRYGIFTLPYCSWKNRADEKPAKELINTLWEVLFEMQTTFKQCPYFSPSFDVSSTMRRHHNVITSHLSQPCSAATRLPLILHIFSFNYIYHFASKIRAIGKGSQHFRIERPTGRSETVCGQYFSTKYSEI